ncbi:hypothetical protein ACHAWO_004273 [Cyclotella atomus]|uniref:Uncharacterized protein n=1 Tax=Cyclotella atomus TaxID=382360 RepID=A0ABD3Q6E3_9STRA
MPIRIQINAFVTAALCCSQVAAFTYTRQCRSTCTPLQMAGGWGNNQERSVSNAEFGGVNGSPIYDSYEIEDRGQFMQRVNAERKTIRNKKAADLLEVARIAGVELKRKEKDPDKLELFDAEDLIGGDDEYLDVSV